MTTLEPLRCRTPAAADPLLQVYLLGAVEFEAALALQRRLVYDVSGDRRSAALVLCEHPPLVTIGREGSWGHLRCDPGELCRRRWLVRWVNRGGGCLLHVPGQLAVYPVVPLDRLGLGLQAYLDRLGEILLAVLADFTVRGERRPGEPRVRVGARSVAELGVAVRDWVTYYGAFLNVNPDLELFRRMLAGDGDGKMTSLERERRGPVKTALVRERLIEHFAARFGFAETALFFDHPALGRKAPSDAVPLIS
jgi:lipoyl(octanoyl) transferase